jgi:hypothetical protein
LTSFNFLGVDSALEVIDLGLPLIFQPVLDRNPLAYLVKHIELDFDSDLGALGIYRLQSTVKQSFSQFFLAANNDDAPGKIGIALALSHGAIFSRVA